MIDATPVEVTIEELILAYRKAKADLFYSSRACRGDLLVFETDLLTNLASIQEALAAGLGPANLEKAWSLAPKDIAPRPETSMDMVADPETRWKRHATKTTNLQATLRVMEALPLAFHVFATLWIQRVGHKLDSKLRQSARGNRLRRQQDNSLNPFSLGTLDPYFRPYTSWRDDGMTACSTALDAGKRIVVISADVKSFYHKLDPRFLTDPRFLDVIAVKLEPSEAALHHLFVNELHTWAQATPLKRGLPVGMVAASLIANLALVELDRIIERELAPLYYGRYVDDVLLVMEDRGNFDGHRAIWDWICKRSDGALTFVDPQHTDIRFTRDYLSSSEIVFSNKKNKTFILNGPTGKSLLNAIEGELRARSSEWRATPELPTQEGGVEASILTASQANGEGAYSFNSINSTSVRRAQFALRLRDVETYQRALPDEAWTATRHAFLCAFTDHILVLPTFVDLHPYVFRVIALATACADFGHLGRMLVALKKVAQDLHEAGHMLTGAVETEEGTKANVDMGPFHTRLWHGVMESVEAAFPVMLSDAERACWEAILTGASTKELFDDGQPWTIRRVQERREHYFCHDLGYLPLKRLLLPREISGPARCPAGEVNVADTIAEGITALLRPKLEAGTRIAGELGKIPVRDELPVGLIFPTRPLGPQDLYLMHTSPFDPTGCDEISACLLAMRGFTALGKLPKRQNGGQRPAIIIPTAKKSRATMRIAITSWHTSRASWTAALTRRPDPDRTRFNRLNHLINDLLRCPDAPDYVVFPELSMPAHWFLGAALKLRRRGISLIAGVDLLHSRRNTVHNQVWCALTHDAFGFPTTVVYRQDKQRPATREERNLRRISGATLRPKVRWKHPPLLIHGDFHFALLLCSELTNIQHRASLRGHIDALFAPEWNQDTTSFSALVESAAADIHTYVIQCNHGGYGDSRIRQPHQDGWARDIVRVKGGTDDYFVVGEIDVLALRQFQSSARSPAKPFKPTPDGFVLRRSRQVLPK